MKANPSQVFMLYETRPADPYEPDIFMSVHRSMEGAQKEVREWPIYPFGRVQPDGSVEAKPIEAYSRGVKIMPVDLKP